MEDEVVGVGDGGVADFGGGSVGDGDDFVVLKGVDFVEVEGEGEHELLLEFVGPELDGGEAVVVEEVLVDLDEAGVVARVEVQGADGGVLGEDLGLYH